MRPCVVMSSPSASVFEKGFATAWEEVKKEAWKLTIPKECTKCKFKPICKVCVAASLLETGVYDGIPDYLCRYSQEYYRLLLEEQNHG